MVAPYRLEVGSEWPEWDQGNSFALRLIEKCITDGFARKELSLNGRRHMGDAPPFKMVCDYHDFVKDDPLVPTPANKTCSFFVQLEPVEDEERHRVTAANLEHNHRLELKAHCFKHLREQEGAVLAECREAIRRLAFEQVRRLKKRYDHWEPSANKTALFERQYQLLQDYAAAFSRQEADAFVIALKQPGLYLQELESDFSPTPSPSGSPLPQKREFADPAGPASAVKKRRLNVSLSRDAADSSSSTDAASLKKEEKPGQVKVARKPQPAFVKREPSGTPQMDNKPFPTDATFTDFLSSLSDSFDFCRFEPHFQALDITSQAQLLEVAAGGTDELGAMLDELENEVVLPDGTKLSGMRKPWRNRLEKLLSERVAP